MRSRHYSVTPVSIGRFPAWELSFGQAKAVVAERGATLLSWDPGVGESLIAGYEGEAELEALSGSRSALMVPWPGRIAHGRFQFGGRDHEFPVNSDGHARHGLIRDAEFARQGSVGSSLELESLIPISDNWPYRVAVSVVFALGSGSLGEEDLTMTVTARNDGDGPAPVALGWHPLLRLPGMKTNGHLQVTIPARTKVLTDKTLIPRRGESAYVGVHSPVRIDFLGSQVIDTSFTGLVPNDDGVVVTSMTNPRTSERITLTQEPVEAPVMHVWTGDGLKRDRRGALALEPCTHLPDAANRADQAQSLALEPGEERSMTTTLTYYG